MTRPLLWIGGGFVLLILAALVAGSVLDSKHAHDRPNPFGAELTVSQYDALKLGDVEQDVVDRFQQSGLPEGRVQDKYVKLFPPHSDRVGCSYWYVTARDGVLARLCFTRGDALLKQKLLRDATPGPG